MLIHFSTKYPKKALWLYLWHKTLLIVKHIYKYKVGRALSKKVYIKSWIFSSWEKLSKQIVIFVSLKKIQKKPPKKQNWNILALSFAAEWHAHAPATTVPRHTPSHSDFSIYCLNLVMCNSLESGTNISGMCHFGEKKFVCWMKLASIDMLSRWHLSHVNIFMWLFVKTVHAHIFFSFFVLVLHWLIETVGGGGRMLVEVGREGGWHWGRGKTFKIRCRGAKSLEK